MNLRFFVISFTLLFFLFISTEPIYAVYDPLSRANNFFGIHILFPDEVSEAAKLVNSNGGDWGYVTIPVRANEKDIDKWQAFMDKCALLHVIPIIRLATEADFSNSSTWRRPDEYDLVDFANFLNSLSWPTKNRYVILFNEINRFDEWGGEPPDPSYYASLISDAYDIFKTRNVDFFVILGGLDNASTTNNKQYINPYEFLRRLVSSNPDVYNKIDGFASHSYPNPAFSDAPNTYKKVGVSTFLFEYNYINSFTALNKPVFITETGWDSKKLNDNTVSNYYDFTFKNIWGPQSDKIVAITPFLLRSEQGQFDVFSFYKNGKPTSYYHTLEGIKKAKGEPILNETFVVKQQKSTVPKIIEFDNKRTEKSEVEVPLLLKVYLKSIFGID